jgi:hypothetical protein
MPTAFAKTPTPRPLPPPSPPWRPMAGRRPRLGIRRHPLGEVWRTMQTGFAAFAADLPPSLSPQQTLDLWPAPTATMSRTTSDGGLPWSKPVTAAPFLAPPPKQAFAA